MLAPRRPLKPLARATRAALAARPAAPVAVLGRALEEELFRVAEVLSEGGCRRAGDVYFGSTMITIDLRRVAAVTRGGLDDRARAALLEAIDGSVRVRLRAMRLARAEAVRRSPGRAIDTVYVETRMRVSGHQLHIDVDLEAAVRVSSAHGAP